MPRHRRRANKGASIQWGFAPPLPARVEADSPPIAPSPVRRRCVLSGAEELHRGEVRDEGAGLLADGEEEGEPNYIPGDVKDMAFVWKQIGDREATQIARELATNTSLRELDLSYNFIGGGGAVDLADALAKNKTLKSLDLYCNEIGDDGAGGAGMEALGRALARNRSLVELDVGGNILFLFVCRFRPGDAGLASFVAGLKVNKGLKSLALRSNCVPDEGAWLVADALKVNSSLTKLDLSENCIGGEGAVALGEALKVNTALRRLDLSGNYIGDEGAVALGEALKVNMTLRRLDLRRNHIGDKGASSWLDVLTERNATLGWLNLEGNAEISAGLLNSIDFTVESRRALKSFCEGLCKPLDKKLTPLVIHGLLQRNAICHRGPALAHVQGTTAGTVFRLVRRAIALNGSKVVGVAPPSRRGSTAGDV
jgi:Leucine Rich repeat